MTFAVIKTGGKQYKVAANDVLKVEKLDAQPGEIVTFDQVLMVGDEGGTTVGLPLVDGATVAAELIETRKGKTVLIIKKHRRQHFDRRNGHRQIHSTVRITEILTGGAQPTIAAGASRRPSRAQTAAAGEAPASIAEEAQTLMTEAGAVLEGTAPQAELPAPDAETAAKKPARRTAKKAAPEAEQE